MMVSLHDNVYTHKPCSITEQSIIFHIQDKTSRYPQKYQKLLPFFVREAHRKEMHQRYIADFVTDEFVYESDEEGKVEDASDYEGQENGERDCPSENEEPDSELSIVSSSNSREYGQTMEGEDNVIEDNID
jgi:hypothetical protein